MSELQLSLLLLGVLGIVAVMLFNRWQEKKYRKQSEKMFSGGRQDVLFDEPADKAAEAPARNVAVERIEPSFDQSAAIARKDEPAHEHRAPPQTAQVATATERAPGVPTTAAPAAAKAEEMAPATSIDETIDLIGVIRVEQPVSANAVNDMSARTQSFSKPVRWQGLEAGRWTEIAVGGQYGELRMALQLADRRGPVTSGDISRFIALAKQFAVEVGGAGETEAEDSAAERATDLDGFCADVDVEIGVNLVTNGDHTMPATKIRALAEAGGLKLSGDGVFSLNDEHGIPLFTLRNSEPRPFVPDHVKNITTHGITLLLDVPRVAHGVQAFDQMLQLARHIAHALGGEVVDDNRKPLTDAGADSIRRQLGLIYRQMSGYGIPAGSPLALRLFS
jgi:FtsZ-interacting cell division protein ZipA